VKQSVAFVPPDEDRFIIMKTSSLHHIVTILTTKHDNNEEFLASLHYIQIYNVPYMSIRKRIWSAAMAPEQLHITGFKQISFKMVFKCQKRIS